ncbi:hypothetical protein DFH06DRAFT_1144023 [Mycena polygramma]|nr:hypothetical protein DFH06DRAFT_1144023 [Mycena polygramma]
MSRTSKRIIELSNWLNMSRVTPMFDLNEILRSVESNPRFGFSHFGQSDAECIAQPISNHRDHEQLLQTKARPAVIAGAILAVVFLAGTILTVLLMGQHNLINNEKRSAAIAPGAGEFSQLKEMHDVESESDLQLEGGTPQNETLTQRVHHVEAQLEALLMQRLQDSAPPSYRG